MLKHYLKAGYSEFRVFFEQLGLRKNAIAYIQYLVEKYGIQD